MDERLLEFSNSYKSPLCFGNIKLFQFGETYLNKGRSIPSHNQHCCEITYVVSGKCKLGADDITTHCNPGDIHIISKNKVHIITASPDENLRYIHFAFGFDKKDEISDFFENAGSLIVKDNGNIQTLLYMLLNEFYSKENKFTEMFRHHIIELIPCCIWRMVNSTADRYENTKIKSNSSGIVYKVIRYIEKTLPDKITVSDIAEHFSYSGNYISHLFKNSMGISLQQYILSERIRYSEKLLCENKLTLEEISEVCKYDSVQSFIRAFKKQNGITPSKFAGNMKNK